MVERDFDRQVAERELVVGVVGLGYVGLPLALAHAETGFAVVGFDVDAERCDALNAGHSHIEDVADARLAAQVGSARIVASADATVLRRADVIFICVPTPYDRHQTPDLSYVRAALASVAAALRPGVLVILQSTTYPGTTVEVCAPALEATGLRAGIDFHLAFSPERVDPGQHRVDGGDDPEGRRRAHARVRAPGGARARVAHGDPRGRDAGLDARGGRDGEAAREHLPSGEHRSRQRARAALQSDGHRRVGGDRRGRHEAVRVRGLPPWHRSRRSLHPRRPAVPVVEGARVRLPHRVHRPRRGHQPGDGRLRARSGARVRGSSGRGARRRPSAVSRAPRSSPACPTSATRERSA